jgi:hypothetical protein
MGPQLCPVPEPTTPPKLRVKNGEERDDRDERDEGCFVRRGTCEMTKKEVKEEWPTNIAMF